MGKKYITSREQLDGIISHAIGIKYDFFYYLYCIYYSFNRPSISIGNIFNHYFSIYNIEQYLMGAYNDKGENVGLNRENIYMKAFELYEILDSINGFILLKDNSNVYYTDLTLEELQEREDSLTKQSYAKMLNNSGNLIKGSQTRRVEPKPIEYAEVDQKLINQIVYINSKQGSVDNIKNKALADKIAAEEIASIYNKQDSVDSILTKAVEDKAKAEEIADIYNKQDSVDKIKKKIFN